jgi:hypothetical protein
MPKIDKIFFGLLFGGIPFLFFFLISLTVWFYFDRNETRIPFYIVPGLLMAIFMDIWFLKGWLKRRYDLPIWFVLAIYLFCNVGIFGFFMGVPVVNVLMGIVAGYYFGNRIQYQHILPENRSGVIHRVSLVTVFVMIIICISSALIALSDETTGENLRLMAGLDFEITKSMIWAIIFTGGTALIAAQYFITKITMILLLKKKPGLLF